MTGLLVKAANPSAYAGKLKALWFFGNSHGDQRRAYTDHCFYSVSQFLYSRLPYEFPKSQPYHIEGYLTLPRGKGSISSTSYGPMAQAHALSVVGLLYGYPPSFWIKRFP